MVNNPRDAPTNDVLEFTSKESLFFEGVENPEFIELFYVQNFPILVLDVTDGDSGSRLDSSGDDSVSLMRNIATHVSFLARA